MDSEKTYVLHYKDLPTCTRLNMVATRKVDSIEVNVVDVADVDNPEAKTTRAVASLRPNGEQIYISIPEGGGELDYEVDVPWLKRCIRQYHEGHFTA